jgi:hypothetical protein
VESSERAVRHQKQNNALHIAPTDRISLLRANNVGAARDMFLALLNGAALIVLDLSQGGWHPWRIGCARKKSAYLPASPRCFAMRSTAPQNAQIYYSRLIHIGGERFSNRTWSSNRRHFSDDCFIRFALQHQRNPGVSYFFMNKRSRIAEDHVPVGYPLEGNEVRSSMGKATRSARARSRNRGSEALPALGYWREPELTR